jgi:hypothetical protein
LVPVETTQQRSTRPGCRASARDPSSP